MNMHYHFRSLRVTLNLGMWNDLPFEINQQIAGTLRKFHYVGAFYQ